MNSEQPSGNQAAEKPASEMSVEELQALLAKKQGEQQAPAEASEEAVDMSYVEMATGEKSGDAASSEQAAPVSPEVAEALVEKITEAEGELKANVEELQSTATEADTALEQAEEELEKDPHAVGAKLVLEKIRDAFDKANDRIIEISSGLLIGGMIGGGAGMAMMKKGQGMGVDQNWDAMANNAMTSYDWSSIGEQVATASTFGSLAAIGATIAFAKIARKFNEKRAKSKYFSARAI